jgi:predicted nucleotidyltransferase
MKEDRQKKIERLIQKIIDELNTKPWIKGLYIFGSQASGEATPVSDLDICVIDDTTYPKEERMEAYSLGNYGVNISLFSELPLYIQFEVFKGRPIFIKDEESVKELKEQTVWEYLDTKYLWDEYWKIKKETGGLAI